MSHDTNANNSRKKRNKMMRKVQVNIKLIESLSVSDEPPGAHGAMTDSKIFVLHVQWQDGQGSNF